MFFPPPWLLALFVLPCVLANTEIVNFSFLDTYNTTDAPSSITWLNHTVNERVLSIVPLSMDYNLHAFNTSLATDSEVWVELRADSAPWSAYERFTARISSPASAPANFYLQIFDPDTSTTDEQAPLRKKLARIRARHVGVSSPLTTGAPNRPPVPVRFVITLEPLLLGVLPQSVLPFLGLAAATVFCAVRFVLPWVMQQLAAPLADLQKDIATAKDLGVRREGKMD
ncbi:hypothetical protein HDZ31DRAFT_62777 [Schizophyllum fasciatum]